MDRFWESFKEFVEQSQLVDIEIGSGWYMWSNKRGGTHHVESRIDRFLVSEDISRGTGEINVSVLPAAGLDHWPISIN